MVGKGWEPLIYNMVFELKKPSYHTTSASTFTKISTILLEAYTRDSYKNQTLLITR